MSSTDLEWQGDAWRRNSRGGWPQNWGEEGTPPQSPASLPTPPCDPQNSPNKSAEQSSNPLFTKQESGRSSPEPWWLQSADEDQTLESNDVPDDDDSTKPTVNAIINAEERPAEPDLSEGPSEFQTLNSDHPEEKRDGLHNFLAVPRLSRSPSPITEDTWGTPQEHWIREGTPMKGSDKEDSEMSSGVRKEDSEGELFHLEDEDRCTQKRMLQEYPSIVQQEDIDPAVVTDMKITRLEGQDTEENSEEGKDERKEEAVLVAFKEYLQKKQEEEEEETAVDVDHTGRSARIQKDLNHLTDTKNGDLSKREEDNWKGMPLGHSQTFDDSYQDNDDELSDDDIFYWEKQANPYTTYTAQSDDEYDVGWEKTTEEEEMESWSPPCQAGQTDIPESKCSPPERNWWEVSTPPPEEDDYEEKSILQAEKDVPWWEAEDTEDPDTPWWILNNFKGTILPPESEVPLPPPLPPSLRGPPVPPPMPSQGKAMSETRRARLEAIRKAARTRPDWHAIMREIEGGPKLNRVSVQEKRDRSFPILPDCKGKNGKFIYESEKQTVHNEMLREIRVGIRLRHVKTNDRSRPDFRKLGLKKLRRQLTVEEKKQIESDVTDLPSSSDEDEDIDKMRDDLQATKTQLEDEIKKTKKLEREQKILKIDIESLQAEVKKLKRQLKASAQESAPLTNGAVDGSVPKLEKSMSKLRMKEEELDFEELNVIDEEINNLKGQILAQKKNAETWELKADELNQKLLLAKTDADEWEMRSVFFEKKFRQIQRDQGIELPDINCAGTQTDPAELAQPPALSEPALDSELYSIPRKSASRRSFTGQFNRMQSFKEEEETSTSSSSEGYEGESEDETSEGEETEVEDGEVEDTEEPKVDGEGEQEEDVEREAENEMIRQERELKLWKSKLSHMKEKEANVKKERNNLRERIRKYFRDMKVERQEYLKVKAELNELVSQENEDEEEEDDESYKQDGEDEELWLEESVLKPKKLKKRKQKKLVSGDEDDEVEEDLEDLTALDEPTWTDSEGDESQSDQEGTDSSRRISNIRERTRRHEGKMNKLKKDNYLLKAQLDRCDEMYLEERRRHHRFEEELSMFLNEI